VYYYTKKEIMLALMVLPSVICHMGAKPAKLTSADAMHCA
jgi:hypothetical protein